MIKRYAIVPGLALASMLGLLGSCQGDRSQDWKADLPPPNIIAFYSDRSGNGDIYLIDLGDDSLNLHRLTTSEDPEYAPRFLSHSGILTYVRDSGGRSQIMGLDAEVDTLGAMCENFAFEEATAFHPDGDQIVFTQQNNYGKLGLMIGSLRGQAFEPILRDTFDYKQPVFSPDGTQLALVSNRDGNQDIWIMAADEPASLRNLTKHPALEGHPAWSPDGREILFYRYEEGDADLYVAPVEGDSEARNLTRSSMNELVGTFSPDGQKIAFGGIADDNWEIFVINRDGSARRRLTNNSAFEGDPVWVSPSLLP